MYKLIYNIIHNIILLYYLLMKLFIVLYYHKLKVNIAGYVNELNYNIVKPISSASSRLLIARDGYGQIMLKLSLSFFGIFMHFSNTAVAWNATSFQATCGSCLKICAPWSYLLVFLSNRLLSITRYHPPYSDTVRIPWSARPGKRIGGDFLELVAARRLLRRSCGSSLRTLSEVSEHPRRHQTSSGAWSLSVLCLCTCLLFCCSYRTPFWMCARLARWGHRVRDWWCFGSHFCRGCAVMYGWASFLLCAGDFWGDLCCARVRLFGDARSSWQSGRRSLCCCCIGIPHPPSIDRMSETFAANCDRQRPLALAATAPGSSTKGDPTRGGGTLLLVFG